MAESGKKTDQGAGGRPRVLTGPLGCQRSSDSEEVTEGDFKSRNLFICDLAPEARYVMQG